MNFVHIQTARAASIQDHQGITLGQVVIWFLWISNIFDMGGSFGIKYVSFAVALLYLSYNYKSLPLDRTTSYLFLFVFLGWPVLSLFYGLFSGSEIALAVSQVTPFFAAITFFLVLQSVPPRYALSAFFGTTFYLAIAACVLFGLLLIEHPVGEYLLSILESSEHGFFGPRQINEEVIPGVYFKATLFLVPTYIYFLYKNKTIKALLVLLALVLAFSKSGFLICILFTLSYIFLFKTKWRFKIGIVTLLLIAIPWFLGFGVFTEELIKSMTGQSETSQIRLDYIDPLITLFNDNPIILLVGQGAGRLFYSGNEGFVSNIEIDYLNAIRKFGLPWFLIFASFVLVLSYNLFRSNLSDGRIMGLALLAIFIVAGTNPVLISPPFLMFMMMSLDFYLRRHETC